jgi:hypothetical protein
MLRFLTLYPRIPGAILGLAMAWSALATTSTTALAAKPDKTEAPLATLVVIGDSLSAGFQNFSLFTSSNGGQNFGFAAVVAQQAGVALSQPTISYPGIPPVAEFVEMTALIFSDLQEILRSALGVGGRELK